MTVFQAIVLGAVQGITEFLPISSSGHLILVPSLLGWPVQDLAFDAAMHLATLAAVVVALKDDVLGLVRNATKRNPQGHLLRHILIATVPVLAAGLMLAKLGFELRDPRTVAFSLAFWAFFLIAADRVKGRFDQPAQTKFGMVFAMGCAQALALIPGTSRSGVTIAAGRFLGLTNEAAARLSFLLGIPAIAASGAYAVLQMAAGSVAFEPLPLAVGFLTAFATGWLAVRLLLRFLRRGRLWPFAVYRLALAAAVLAFA